MLHFFTLSCLKVCILLWEEQTIYDSACSLENSSYREQLWTSLVRHPRKREQRMWMGSDSRLFTKNRGCYFVPPHKIRNLTIWHGTTTTNQMKPCFYHSHHHPGNWRLRKLHETTTAKAQNLYGTTMAKVLKTMIRPTLPHPEFFIEGGGHSTPLSSNHLIVTVFPIRKVQLEAVFKRKMLEWPNFQKQWGLRPKNSDI